MAFNISDFVGTFTVKIACATQPPGVVEKDDKLHIGTGAGGVSEPFVGPDGDVQVGVSLIGSGGTKKLSPSGFAFNGAYLTFTDTSQKPHVHYQISHQATPAVSGARMLFGITSTGDPDDVAVWGAEDDPDDEQT